MHHDAIGWQGFSQKFFAKNKSPGPPSGSGSQHSPKTNSRALNPWTRQSARLHLPLLHTCGAQGRRKEAPSSSLRFPSTIPWPEKGKLPCCPTGKWGGVAPGRGRAVNREGLGLTQGPNPHHGGMARALRIEYQGAACHPPSPRLRRDRSAFAKAAAGQAS